jgi:hypothetical protein
MREKNARSSQDPQNDPAMRYDEAINRARRGFQHDGPGGNYEGF